MTRALRNISVPLLAPNAATSPTSRPAIMFAKAVLTVLASTACWLAWTQPAAPPKANERRKARGLGRVTEIVAPRIGPYSAKVVKVHVV
jgi:hypothetical protein